MDHLLRTQAYGRLSCGAGEDLYIVPLSYVYNDGYLYAHSKEGKKIWLMRKDPRVCFQVDEIHDSNNWWSIITWATYEELGDDPLKSKAIQLINDRFAAFSPSKSVHPHSSNPHMTGFAEKAAHPVFFRLKILKMTGRSERSEG
ncbi:MAG TPA: pyridoxamine 5'-phosphate oxidase family protein [Cyclobacteriaceae bacterium]|nr:pyridoxamine 5'-phosphate oxidase family protein [Cyclobacteriaceae bacterium]